MREAGAVLHSRRIEYPRQNKSDQLIGALCCDVCSAQFEWDGGREEAVAGTSLDADAGTLGPKSGPQIGRPDPHLGRPGAARFLLGHHELVLVPE